MFIYQTKIKLHETDAAGVLFFSNQLRIVHDAYESLLERIGFGFTKLINEKDFFLPIVHSESDYKTSLSAGDLVEIQTMVAHVGKTSFTLAHKLVDATRTIVGTVRTVHVSIDKKTRQKIPLPGDLRAKMEELQAEDQEKISI